MTGRMLRGWRSRCRTVWCESAVCEQCCRKGEVWVFPDGVRCVNSIACAETADLQAEPTLHTPQATRGVVITGTDAALMAIEFICCAESRDW